MSAERPRAPNPPAAAPDAAADAAPPCPACGATGRQPLPVPAARWTYWRCPACAHESLWPLPTPAELATHYNTTYAVPRDRYERRAHARLQQCTPWFPKASGGSALEVGCSYGAVLAGLRNVGWRTEGIELDARAAAVARDERGLRVHAQALDEARPHLREAPYGLVVALHVIEHLPDPAAWLAALRRLSAPGARLVLATPNAASRAARMAGRYWEWRAAPDHVHLFSPDSLTRLLGAAGFAVRATATGRGDAHSLGFEWVRGAAKRWRDQRSSAGPVRHAADDPARPSAAWWYSATQSFLDAASGPLEAALGPLEGAELRLVAEAVPQPS